MTVNGAAEALTALCRESRKWVEAVWKTRRGGFQGVVKEGVKLAGVREELGGEELREDGGCWNSPKEVKTKKNVVLTIIGNNKCR